MKTNRLFDVVAGDTLIATVSGYQCNICHKKTEEIVLVLEATDNYSINDGTFRRKWLHFHNPVCNCCKEIFLPDGPIVKG